MQLITSPNVLTAAGTNPKAAVLERIQKAGDVVQELQKAVTSRVMPGTYLIEVSMTSNDGYEAATIVNAVVDAFIEANSEWSDGMTRQQIRNLEQYSVDLKNQTDELERKWMSLAAQGGLDLGLSAYHKKDDARPTKQNGDNQRASRSRNTGGPPGTEQVKLELAQAEAWLTTAKAAIARAARTAPAEEQEMIDDRSTGDSGSTPRSWRSSTETKKAEAKVDDAERIVSSA